MNVQGKKGSNNNNSNNNAEEEGDTLYGDFEDLETGEKFTNEKAEEEEQDSDNEAADEDEQLKRLAMKEKLKEAFDAEYDAEDKEDEEVNPNKKDYFDELKESIDKQAIMNKTEFANENPELRAQYEGFRIGTYVRIEINNVPCEFVKYFNPDNPIIVGGLQPSEESLGFVQIRIKKHRWHKKILKNQDPLVFSIGIYLLFYAELYRKNINFIPLQVGDAFNHFLFILLKISMVEIEC